MHHRFKEFVDNENLFDIHGRILLGVSGGIDSMVMMNLFQTTGCHISTAHCNFNLRGNESDIDQLFVSDYCQKHNIPFYVKNFDTESYAADNKMSLQMAARELRYSWFYQLAAENGYRYIAIAHNKNDLAETFLINLVRGTGIRGLTGIRAKSGKIIRPLLFADRKEIMDYALKNNIDYREDSSNREIKYRRNRIRLRIIPEFEAISSDFSDTLYETSKKLKDVEAIYINSINKKFNEIATPVSYGYILKISSLMQLDPLTSYLYEFLRRWNFPRELVPDIIASLTGPPGKQFFSSTHRLIKDRDNLIITPDKINDSARYYIDEDVKSISHPIKLSFTRVVKHQGFIIPNNPKTACLDQDLLHFPLILRKWQKGDYFQPLGMSGLKKLSDFFIDNKFSLVEKEKTWLLASGNKLAWIVGHRIDNRFRITERTGNILVIEMQE